MYVPKFIVLAVFAATAAAAPIAADFAGKPVSHPRRPCTIYNGCARIPRFHPSASSRER
jgi:hypothetical protein